MTESHLAKDLTLEEFRHFRDYIHEHSGIFLEENKSDSLRISLITRATRHQFGTLAEYFELLVGDEEEFNELLNLVTINETSFFRFPGQFEAFQTTVVPEIMESKSVGNRDFRVWSAGCSTGEEPYSVAMSLLDSGIQGLGWKPYVLGTDVSTKALRMARTGIYSGRTLLNLSDDVLQRHFEETSEGYRVAEHVRKVVEFSYHNLIKEPYPLALMGNWDVIFCRNVTIYFKMESTKRVVSNFFNSLNDGGYLFIGHSETLTSVSEQFEACEIGGIFLYRKPRRPHATRFSFERLVGDRAGRKQRSGHKDAAPQRVERRHRAAQAAPEPVEAPEVGERSVADVLAEARKLAQAGEPTGVLDLVETVLASDPANVEAYLLAAHAHADTGAFAEALAECHKAIAIDPLQPTARYILGVIYQRQDDAVRAISEFRKTIYIAPDFALAHLNLGNIYRSQRKMDAACKEYENAVRCFRASSNGEWTSLMGGFDAGLLIQTCERSLVECRKVSG